MKKLMSLETIQGRRLYEILIASEIYKKPCTFEIKELKSILDFYNCHDIEEFKRTFIANAVADINKNVKLNIKLQT